MSPEEIERIVRVLRRFGVEYIKLTGGEPMLRRDIVEIVSRIKGVGVREISMTTNGTNLEKLAYKLKDAGLSRVNISLHSLKRDRYRFITRVDALDKTLRAVNAAINAGLLPVKLNIVLLKGINDDEIWEIIDYSYQLGGNKTNTVQFIELLNIDEAIYEKYHVELDGIEARIKERAVDIRYRKLHNRPVYLLDNGVQVEFVKPMFNHAFCMGDDRIRITYDGKFKPCLMRNDNLVDFISAMRNGATDEQLAKLYIRAIMNREPFFKEKHPGHIDKSVCMI